MSYPLFGMTKLEILKDMIANEKFNDAIKFAAKFPQLGKERNAILSASSALLSPRVYVSMGKDPEQVIQAGIDAIRAKYRL